MMTYCRFFVRNQICAVSIVDVLIALGLQGIQIEVGPFEGQSPRRSAIFSQLL